MSDAEAIRQRSDSVPLVPLQTDPLTGADAAPPHPRAYVPGPRDGADPPPESMFGPYRLQELIGRGGMGEIYRAYDTSRGRVVALKRLPAALAADPVFQARFRSEAALAARLHEPHVIPIHDFGEIDGQLYIDMRLVDGPDLATVLDCGPLPPRRVVDIVTQVASALDAAHAAGLVHRDIKPANILITGPEPGGAGGDFVYVADFGIARAVDGSASGSLTSTGTMVGSLDYIAPERFDRDPGDRRVDIYALGCVLFQALTGRRPFPVEGLPAIINAHLNTPPPAASGLRPSIPAGLDAVIACAMAKHPDHRYPSAAALALDARRALDGETVIVAPNLSARTTPPDQRAHSRAPWLDSAIDSHSRVTGPVAPGTFPPSSPATSARCVGGPRGAGCGGEEPPVACPRRGADRRPRARPGRVMVTAGAPDESNRERAGNPFAAPRPDHPASAVALRAVPGPRLRRGCRTRARGRGRARPFGRAGVRPVRRRRARTSARANVLHHPHHHQRPAYDHRGRRLVGHAHRQRLPLALHLVARERQVAGRNQPPLGRHTGRHRDGTRVYRPSTSKPPARTECRPPGASP